MFANQIKQKYSKCTASVLCKVPLPICDCNGLAVISVLLSIACCKGSNCHKSEILLIILLLVIFFSMICCVGPFSIDPRHPLKKLNFQAVSHTVDFIYMIKKK